MRNSILVVGRDESLPLPQDHPDASPMTREQEIEAAYQQREEMELWCHESDY